MTAPSLHHYVHGADSAYFSVLISVTPGHDLHDWYTRKAARNRDRISPPKATAKRRADVTTTNPASVAAALPSRNRKERRERDRG